MGINIGRLLMLCVWGFMLVNIVHPYTRPLNIFMNVALVFMVLMHGLQVTMLKTTLTKDQPKISKWQEVRIFLFGVFELLAWQKKKYTTEKIISPNSPPQTRGGDAILHRLQNQQNVCPAC